MPSIIKRAAYSFLSLRRFQLTSSIEPFRLSSHALIFVMAGEGHGQINGAAYQARAGTCYWLSPSSWIAADVQPGKELDCYWLQFTLPGSSRRQADAQRLAPHVWGLASTAPAISALLAQLAAYAGKRKGAAYFHQQALFHDLLYHLSQLTGEQSLDATIARTMKYMDDHFMDNIQVGQLPELANMAASAYCRAFKKMTGVTPSTYLTNARINMAKELLRSPGRGTLKQIAQSVGFTDELYFSRVFKKTAGVSPSVYASSSQMRVAVVSHLFLQDHLLALGVTPVAAPAFPTVYATSSGFPSYLHQQLQTTLPLNAERRIALQDVQRIEPDMIIKMDFSRNPSDSRWQDARNTVCLEGFSQWQHYLEALGKMVHREQAATPIIHRIEQLEAEYKQRLWRAVAPTGNWAIIRVLPGDFRIYGSHGHALSDLIYRGLGFQAHSRLDFPFYKRSSLRELALVDPDNIFIIWSDPAEVKRLQQQPLWQSLRAARELRIYVPNSREWDPWGPTGREYMIYGCARYFSEALARSQ